MTSMLQSQPKHTTQTEEFQLIRDCIENGKLTHVAVIMDGNRRWAECRGKSPIEGHYEGYRAIKNLVEYTNEDLHLPVLTVYAFSTENWQRSEDEVDSLMALFHQTVLAETPELIEKNIRLKILGSKEKLPNEFVEACNEAERLTEKNTGLLYQVALNYGSRAEMVSACRQLAEDVKAGKISPDQITEEAFSQNLYTSGSADPDMIIRTGGSYRLSNFLLWQSAYSEICVIDELWPEFTSEIFNRTVLDFMNRQRRFGK